MITASLWTATRPASERVSRHSASHSRISSAGPDAKAEARNRGARIAVCQNGRPGSPEYRNAVIHTVTAFQNGRPGSPQYRNAVTVWMLMAHGIETTITGRSHEGGGRSFRSEPRVTVAITAFNSR